MRLSDKMTQTRHNLDEIYDSLGEGITSALNEMFEYGAEAEMERIIKLLEEHITYYDDEGFDVCSKCGKVYVSIENHLIALIKGEK